LPTRPTNTCCLWATSFLAGTAHPRCASPHNSRTRCGVTRRW
jgi:hypothetical protein